MTIIALFNSLNCELCRVSLKYEDATGEAIAKAAMEIIQQTGSLSEGDSVRVFED